MSTASYDLSGYDESRDDPQAQVHGVYADHHRWLHGLLQRRLGCSETAADLAHDVFLRLITRPRRLDSFEGARAYLSTLARGICIDHWRRREIERAWLEVVAAQPEALAPSAEYRAMVIETLCQVDAMLRRLPENVARAFLMSQLQGLTYRAIAGELGVSERMVKKYMARAMLQCALVEAGLERG